MSFEKMKYGQIAKNKSINKMIYNCFQYLDDSDVNKFVKKFKVQPDNENQILHTFRELILGAFLSKNNFQVKHDYVIDSKTPDWCILNNKSQPQSIIELTNFHPDAKTSKDITHQLKEKGIWANFTTPNTKRLYQVIWDKASKYKSIIDKYGLGYVISVFGEFTAIVNQDEIDECLFDKESGLFKKYPTISGLLYFEESSGSYFFIYKPNPFAKRIINMPKGQFQINN